MSRPATSWRYTTPETEEERVQWEAAKAADLKKEAARAATAKFMRDNFIRRPETCECLAPKPQVHHVDYDRPLIIAFLCRRCHADLHAGRLLRAYRIHDLKELVSSHVQVSQ